MHSYEELKLKYDKLDNLYLLESEQLRRTKDELKLLKMDMENLQHDYDQTIEKMDNRQTNTKNLQ